ncbi:transposase [Klebsiella pneumoniae]|uniref:transposase n=1 Tax=Klebsiella pneumoniae TaxID=573 RepID=UPI003AB97940
MSKNSYLASDAVDDDPMTPLLGHSITYPYRCRFTGGRKVFTLQTLPTSGDPFGDGIGKVAGSSLHARRWRPGPMNARKLERLCRYISRPAVCREAAVVNTRRQRALPAQRRRYRDGNHRTSFFEPLDFIARLAALVPKPRVKPNPLPRGVSHPTVGTGVGHAGKTGRGNKVRGG